MGSDEMHYMTHVLTTDISTNWGVSVGKQKWAASTRPWTVKDGTPQFHVYKFFPSTDQLRVRGRVLQPRYLRHRRRCLQVLPWLHLRLLPRAEQSVSLNTYFFVENIG